MGIGCLIVGVVYYLCGNIRGKGRRVSGVYGVVCGSVGVVGGWSWIECRIENCVGSSKILFFLSEGSE